jgi:hypothetical protein
VYVDWVCGLHGPSKDWVFSLVPPAIPSVAYFASLAFGVVWPVVLFLGFALGRYERVWWLGKPALSEHFSPETQTVQQIKISSVLRKKQAFVHFLIWMEQEGFGLAFCIGVKLLKKG